LVDFFPGTSLLDRHFLAFSIYNKAFFSNSQNQQGLSGMITGEKNKVDKIWETFWTGGITNPLTLIE
jgi:hypothetical protein